MRRQIGLYDVRYTLTAPATTSVVILAGEPLAGFKAVVGRVGG